MLLHSHTSITGKKLKIGLIKCLKTITAYISLTQYNRYLDVQHYHAFDEISFIKIISKKQFKLVHEDTKHILGPFKEFSLDKTFKIIDTEYGKLKISDCELKDLLDGKYDFLIDS